MKSLYLNKFDINAIIRYYSDLYNKLVSFRSFKSCQTQYSIDDTKSISYYAKYKDKNEIYMDIVENKS